VPLSPAASNDSRLQLKAETTIQILQPLLESFLGARIQPEWFDHATQPGEAGEKKLPPVTLACWCWYSREQNR